MFIISSKSCGFDDVEAMMGWETVPKALNAGKERGNRWQKLHRGNED